MDEGFLFFTHGFNFPHYRHDYILLFKSMVWCTSCQPCSLPPSAVILVYNICR